jgi:hypothetical protein
MPQSLSNNHPAQKTRKHPTTPQALMQTQETRQKSTKSFEPQRNHGLHQYEQLKLAMYE